MSETPHGFRLAPRPPVLVEAAIAYEQAALSAAARPMQGMMALRDVAYGPRETQAFDLFGPVPDGRARPILVFLHGGGWQGGRKEWTGLMARAAAAHGLLLAAPTYRLAPEHRWPSFLDDSLAALAAIRARAGAFGGDPDRLLLGGHSAGGQIAAMMALRPDLLARAGLPDGALRGALPVSGILDLRHPDPPPGSLEELVYRNVLESPADDVLASPVAWADRARVPFHLAWGEHDTPRVRASNTLMTAALRGAGRPVSGEALEGLDHFSAHLALEDAGHPWWGVAEELVG